MIIFGKQFFYPKQLWVLKIIGRRIGPKKFIGLKQFSVIKYSKNWGGGGPKTFWLQRVCCAKKSWVQHIFVP